MSLRILLNRAKKKFLDAYRALRALGNNENLSKLTDLKNKNNSSILSPKFCDDAVQCQLLADQGYDSCIFSPQVFAPMRKVDSDLNVKYLNSPN